MSVDEDVLRYKRALERGGMDPRAIAAGLLGVAPDRYLLIARPYEAPRVASIQREAIVAIESQRPTEPEPRWRRVIVAIESQRPTEPEPRWRRVTGVMAASTERRAPALMPAPPIQWHVEHPERWRALWALPILALEEKQRVIEAGVTFLVWDAAASREVEGLGFGRWPDRMSYSRIEEGWREPRDGPPTNIGPAFAPWSVRGDGTPWPFNTTNDGHPRFGATGSDFSGPLCAFCDAPIDTDGISCSCPPCVLCRGPHPATRCPARGPHTITLPVSVEESVIFTPCSTCSLPHNPERECPAPPVYRAGDTRGARGESALPSRARYQVDDEDNDEDD